jgi:GT2 family glycosyltransferase
MDNTSSKCLTDKQKLSLMRSHYGLRIIIPLFYNSHLLEPLSNGLLSCVSEIRDSNGIIMLVNDSPDDKALSKAISIAIERLGDKGITVEVDQNEQNIGFIKSANKGLAAAVSFKQNALLLNSDVILKSGCINELISVASIDPMIAFVSPRSNNATICSLPHPVDGKYHSEDTSSQHQIVSKWLPRFYYAPSAVGFCLYIKYAILSEFGLLDEIYGFGYNEENDLIMRANRAGYRAAIANRAYAYHFGSVSFGLKEKIYRENINERILNKRYPEYLSSVNRYMNSANYLSEGLFSTFVPDEKGKLALGIDLSHLGPFFNGTFEMAINILKQLSQRDGPFSFYVICSPNAATFHKIDEIQGVRILPPNTKKTFAILLRMGQPHTWEDVYRMSILGALNIYFMLDTITWDCSYLLNGEEEIDKIWRFVLKYSDGIIFNSKFTMNQFCLRFPIPKTMPKLVALHSTSPMDYLAPIDNESVEQKHILVVGNHYRHKFVGETIDALTAAFPGEDIVALGLEYHPSPRVTTARSGELGADVIDGWYKNALCVVFPSHYEGFGIPVIKGTSYNKRTYFRTGPLAEELMEHSAKPWLLSPYETTQELLERLKNDLPQIKSGKLPENNPPLMDRCLTWKDSAAAIETFLVTILESRKSNAVERIQAFPNLMEQIQSLNMYFYLREIYRAYVLPIKFIGPLVRKVIRILRRIQRLNWKSSPTV